MTNDTSQSKSSHSPDQEKRFKILQRPIVVWLTGLSGSGKSTLAYYLERELFRRGFYSVVLDGDIVRGGLCSDLGYAMEDRAENLRRVAEVAKLLLNSGLIVITALISPSEDSRNAVRLTIGSERFLMVHVNCDLQICESRDVKGLYAKAKAGFVQNFTGISAPYELPIKFDIKVETAFETISESADRIMAILLPRIDVRRL